MAIPHYNLSSEVIENIYSCTLDTLKQYPSRLLKDFEVHDVHKNSVGLYPGKEYIKNQTSCQYALPDLNNFLCVPFFGSNSSDPEKRYKISHIRLIGRRENSDKTKVVSMGPDTLGWFNLHNAAATYSREDYKGKKVRLTLHDSLTSALKMPNDIHSNVIIEPNMEILSDITRLLSIKGSRSFFKKFQNIKSFDILVGNTNLGIDDWSINNFIYDELIGVPSSDVCVELAGRFMKNLTTGQRYKFVELFKKIYKVDLRNVLPYMFEKHYEEREFLKKVREKIYEQFDYIDVTFKTTGTYVKVHSKILRKEVVVSLEKKTIIPLLEYHFGDLYEFCYSLGGLPVSYLYDRDKGTRYKRKIETSEFIEDAMFRIFREGIKKADVK